MKHFFVYLIILGLPLVNSAQVFQPELIFVRGGSFKMGTIRGVKDEQPGHVVTLDDFYIGKFEVTQNQWKQIMDQDTSKRYIMNCGNCPTERVSWYNVMEFIEKLNLETGLNYRLPTEAEWEYAAKGGKLSKGFAFSGSDTIDVVAWKDGNAGNTTHPVGKKKPNELGIYDMTGNVFEWCSDWYSPTWYEVSEKKNPAGPEAGTFRVMRGGSWFHDHTGLRITEREKGNPSYRYGYVGFRLCRSASDTGIPARIEKK
ncbi:MAG: SUMF1/EgtB/PvdO family nonheme iron enzyme [Bacteroidetes bacterium]|nr:SUMF1/EgtB/PvdO family nonheme iron enzyme [Bacteroidota bacterium]